MKIWFRHGLDSAKGELWQSRDVKEFTGDLRSEPVDTIINEIRSLYTEEQNAAKQVVIEFSSIDPHRGHL